MTNPTAAALIERSNRLGADPKNTNYAGGNTSAKGTDDRPRHRAARRAALGQGIRRRPRHAHGAGTRGAAPRPHARPRRRLPRPRPRGRDGRRVRLLPARQGRRRPLDRHGHARARRCRARRPSASRLRHRDRDRRGRRGADRDDLRREGRLGAVAAPRLPARSRHRRDQGEEPAGDRLHPRRPRHHRVGRHVGGGRGELAVDHRHGCRLHRRARQGRPVRRHRASASRRCPRPSGASARPLSPAPSAASPRPTGRWSATSPTPMSCSTSSPPSAPPSSRPSARAAPITSCAPRSSH